ncbi:MAG: M1 family metallopeptidase [Saprospiraceae bacterium]|nr:M1 family metallopeptidase [Saprospiraceae bacterium]
MKIHLFTTVLLIALSIPMAWGQPLPTRSDSLIGYLSPLRSSFDVTSYELDLRVDPSAKWISGKCLIYMRILAASSRVQIDLDRQFNIAEIRDEKGRKLSFDRQDNAVFIQWRHDRQKGEYASLLITYEGKPQEARNPPWDGGFTWGKDKDSNPWVVVTCQGLGASSWWPNKDHGSDEPDSMRISITVPPGLMDVSNGRLEEVKVQDDQWTKYVWKVHHPINNYNVTLNIGQFAHFKDWHISPEGDSLSLDYYVLPQDLAKAKVQFKQVDPMLTCYESHFGSYPFPKDGYKLIQSPHPGMEHQTAIAYGNYFENGYRRKSNTAEGMWFDYIIIHESAHEWFGNSISTADFADMWIHESFANYLEAVYMECLYGYESACNYIVGLKKDVLFDRPIVGPYHIHQPGSRDMYPKGALMLHTLRHVVANDDLWWTALKSLSLRFRHKIVTYDDVTMYLSKALGHDYSLFFDQYLRKINLPVLEMSVVPAGSSYALRYRWSGVDVAFDMPVRVNVDEKSHLLRPTTAWKVLAIHARKKPKVTIDRNWFVEPKMVD